MATIGLVWEVSRPNSAVPGCVCRTVWWSYNPIVLMRSSYYSCSFCWAWLWSGFMCVVWGTPVPDHTKVTITILYNWTSGVDSETWNLFCRLWGPSNSSLTDVGGARDARPFWVKSSHFHAVFGKNSPLLGWRLLDPPMFLTLFSQGHSSFSSLLDQLLDVFTLFCVNTTPSRTRTFT